MIILCIIGMVSFVDECQCLLQQTSPWHSAVVNLIIHHLISCFTTYVDCIMRQNKLEELGVKYALQKREASASNEIQSL